MSTSCFRVFTLMMMTLIMGCASNQEKIIKYKELLVKDDYRGALDFFKSKEIYSDNASELLKYIEIGTLQTKLGNHYQSLKAFNKAQEIADKLFTISLSKKIVGSLLEDSFDNYSGEKFERSYIRYYQILNHYNIYDQGFYESYEEDLLDEKGKVIGKKPVEAVILNASERSFHLQASRAVLLEWNAMMEDLKKSNAGDVVYKDDLLLKLLGAIIHEKGDSSSELQIARALYKETPQTLLRHYNHYESFNLKFKDFNKNYSSFPKLKEADILKDYVVKTNNPKLIEEYASEKEKSIRSKDKDNVYLLWHEGLISSKIMKKFEFPIIFSSLPLAMSEKSNFMKMSSGLLNLRSVANPVISIEYSTIPNRVNLDQYQLIVKQNEKIIKMKDALLVGPLSEVAHFTFEEEHSAALAAKGTRVAAKYLAALISAYASYKAVYKEGNDQAAYFAAFLTFLGLEQAIKETEKADIRGWVSLPHQIRMNSFKLNPGKYELFAMDKVSGIEKKIGDFEIGNESINLKTFL